MISSWHGGRASTRQCRRRTSRVRRIRRKRRGRGADDCVWFKGVMAIDMRAEKFVISYRGIGQNPGRIGLMKARYRTCPGCGCAGAARFMKSFQMGTWKKCLSCGEEYRPPMSLAAGILSLLVAAGVWATLVLMFADRASARIMLFPCLFAIGFTGFGLFAVVSYVRTPSGPADVKGFPVQLIDKPRLSAPRATENPPR